MRALLFLPLLFAQAAPVGRVEGDVLAIRAGKIFTAAGRPIDGGVILIENGKITSVGTGAVPAGARVLDFPDAWATPGLIDLHCHVGGTLRDINDMVHPTNPELSTKATIDPESELLKDAVAGGVTTVLYIPASLARGPGDAGVGQRQEGGRQRQDPDDHPGMERSGRGKVLPVPPDDVEKDLGAAQRDDRQGDPDPPPAKLHQPPPNVTRLATRSS